MFKFRDDSYIEGQLDLCNTVNDKYPALTEFFDSEKGYDIVDYNRRSTTSIEKVVYEAGDPTNYHTPYKDVANYWRVRGHHKGSEAILHKFHYTNDTGKTGKVYITVYDHFQNNALDYCDWWGDPVGGWGADFWYDSDIDVRIRAFRNYGARTRQEERTREEIDTIPVMTRQKHYVYWYDDGESVGHISESSSNASNNGKENSGLQLEEEPEYGGRKYLEKQDFILAKQKEQLVAQSQTIQEQEAVIQEKEEKLDELTLKLDDVEALIDDVSEIAYDKAVEVVTDTVRVETHKQDIQLVEETKSWLLSPERKAPKKEREYAAARLDNVVSKITKAMQTALSVMKAALTKPEVRKANTQQIKEKARTSIYEMLNRNKAIVAAEDAARKKETHKKQNMER